VREAAADERRAVVRPMRADDFDAALDLWVASWQAAYPAIDFAARRAWMAERLALHQADGAHCVIACDADGITGLLVINAQTRYLDQIAVGPGRRGSGIADALLAEAKRLSPAGFALHVNQDNARAIRFYEKHGLSVAGEGVNERSGAPIYRMRWEP
jgi:putative acetyltransferase